VSLGTFGAYTVKAACKMLVKSTPGVNFINILQAAFSYKRVFAAFLYLNVGFEIFWLKNICAKAAREMLMKLTIFYKQLLI